MLNDTQIMEAYKKIEEAEYGTKQPESKKEQGAKDAPQKFEGDKEKIDTPAENKRDPGADKAQKDFDGNKGSVGKAENDKGKQGAKEAPKKFESIEDYKNRLRGALGLPLDSDKNKGNKGIQK